MNEQEIKNHVSKLKKKLGKAEQDKQDYIKENEGYEVEIKSLYRSVQDMTVDYITTTDAIKKMENLRSFIKSNEAKIERRNTRILECLDDLERAECY